MNIKEITEFFNAEIEKCNSRYIEENYSSLDFLEEIRTVVCNRDTKITLEILVRTRDSLIEKEKDSQVVKEHSMNDYIYFKLTDVGKKFYTKYYTRYKEPFKIEKTYYKDWYREQLHETYLIFSESCFVGCLLPVTDITFEDPKPKE